MALNGLTLSGRARGLRLSRQKREFEESGCSLLESAAGPRADIQNVTRGTVYRAARLPIGNRVTQIKFTKLLDNPTGSNVAIH